MEVQGCWTALALELVAKSKLEYARCGGRAELTEGGGGAEGQRRVREVMLVEGVEGFCTELKGVAFKGHKEALCHGDVPVLKSIEASNGTSAGLARILIDEVGDCARGGEERGLVLFVETNLVG